MYKTLVFHLGRLFCFSMAAPSPFVYLNTFISNNNHTYANQRTRNSTIPRIAYIPFALKLATLSYACSSWTKASLILQQQFQIVTTKNILSENEKKLISGLHISIAYLLLRLFHQKNGTIINLKRGGRFEQLNLFSSKLIIPLIIGLIICTIIEESGLLLLLQITSGSRRVYSISGKNAIKVEGFRDDSTNPSDKNCNNTFKTDIENRLNEEKSRKKLTNNKNNIIQSSNSHLSSFNNEQQRSSNKSLNEEINNTTSNIKEKEEKIENAENDIIEESIPPKKIFYHDDCCVCLGSCEYPQMETFCASEIHVAHTQCMLKWLQASKKRQCPLCRQPLQVYIISESMHDYMYGYPPLYKIIQRNIDWKCFLKRTGITLYVTTSLLLILKLRMMTNHCKYNNLRYSSSA